MSLQEKLAIKVQKNRLNPMKVTTEQNLRKTKKNSQYKIFNQTKFSKRNQVAATKDDANPFYPPQQFFQTYNFANDQLKILKPKDGPNVHKFEEHLSVKPQRVLDRKRRQANKSYAARPMSQEQNLTSDVRELNKEFINQNINGAFVVTMPNS